MGVLVSLNIHAPEVEELREELLKRVGAKNMNNHESYMIVHMCGGEPAFLWFSDGKMGVCAGLKEGDQSPEPEGDLSLLGEVEGWDL